MRATSARASGGRIAAAIVVGLVAVALCALNMVDLWTNLTEQDSHISNERAGIAYARPLMSLTTALALAESAASRGVGIDRSAIESAIESADTADALHGAKLGVSAGWGDLRNRVTALMNNPGSHDANAFAETLGLGVGLLWRVRDASGLSVDSDPVSHYLIDAALDQLPTVMLNAASAAGQGGELTAETTATLAVAYYQLTLGAQAVAADLQTVAASGGGTTDGSSLTGRLDALQAAVRAVTPTALVQLVADPSESTSSAIDRLHAAALALEQAMLGQIDDRLRSRSNDIANRRRVTIAEAAGVLVALVAVLWLLSPRRTVPTDTAADSDTDEPYQQRQEIALIQARDLLGIEELVHVGRAVRPRRPEHDDAE